MPSPATAARLYLPDRSLAGCLHLAVERDTQGLNLTDAQRFNYFPASPLPTMTWIFAGELRRVEGLDSAAPVRFSAPLPRVLVSGPQRRPVVSWSPGPVHALMASFYPQAWGQLLGLRAEDYRDRTVALAQLPPSPAQAALLGLAAPGGAAMAQLTAVLPPLWQSTPSARGWRDLRGWLHSVALRAALAPTGTSVRQAQRRFRDWTGQSQRELALFARVEAAFSWSPQGPVTGQGLAALAADTGYSDQSHLGREVKRVTGLSPARFAERLQTDEAFWLYRLLDAHLRQGAD